MTHQKLTCVYILTVTVTIAGCMHSGLPVDYLGDAEVTYYKEAATEIAHPHLHEPIAEEATQSVSPRSLNDRGGDEVWDVTLGEALHTAMANSRVIRTLQAPNGSSVPLTNPANTSTIYDPAIQESGVLFGRRGVEAALADFDAQFTTSMLWGRDEQIQNNAFFGGGLDPGNTLTSETGAFNAGIRKQFAHGGNINVFQTWDYLGSNVPSQLFPSAYRGILGVEYRHPLLAGSGTEYTRIAGPINPNFGAIAGVSQGVVIARINQDITLADFELSVRNMLFDVEQAYWNLYLQYRLHDTAVTARNSALRTWREAKAKLDVGGVANFKPADEAQARDRYFETNAAAKQSLSQLYLAELELRRLMGLPVNDGRVIRPVDELTTAKFLPEWELSLAEALTERVELRRQKWTIKSLELQLQAAQSLVRPRLDFVSRYRVNGFGDRLFGENDDDGVTAQGLDSAYETLTQGNQTGWQVGFELGVPLGFRSSRTQVINYELQLARARELLAAQELDIAHELAASFQSLNESYETAQSNFNRRRAAQRRVELFEAELDAGTATLDDVLRAQASLADAERAYFSSLVAYNREIAFLEFRKGTLLNHNNVILSEGGWTHEAYEEAYERARARSHAIDAPWLHSEPEVFERDCFDCPWEVGPFGPGALSQPPLDPEAIAPPVEETPSTDDFYLPMDRNGSKADDADPIPDDLQGIPPAPATDVSSGWKTSTKAPAVEELPFPEEPELLAPAD